MKFHETLRWSRDADIWAQDLSDKAIKLLEDYLNGLVDHYAPQIEEWMKVNASWQDRTGDARKGLHTEVETLVGESYTIVLDHTDSIDYGIWLELKHQGRFAIIQPALDHWFPLIINDIRNFLK